MDLYHAVKVDVSSKQNYIFSSNRLKDVVGASKIIEFVTTILGRIIIEHMKSNGKKLSQKKFTEEYEITEGEKTTKYRGNIHIENGGNSIYMFGNKEDAKEFTKRFTIYVLEKFNGLRVDLVTEKFNLDSDLGFILYHKLEKKLMIKKNGIQTPIRQLNIGIFNKCPNTSRETGYEIEEISDFDKSKLISRAVSKETFDKVRFYDEILMGNYSNLSFNGLRKENYYEINDSSEIRNKIRWMSSYYSKDNINRLIDDDYKDKITSSGKDFDNIINESKNIVRAESIKAIAGNDLDNSYIGLSFLDGNGMGNAFRAISKDFVSKLITDVNKLDGNNYELMQGLKAYETNIKVDSNKEVRTLIKESNLYFFNCYEILTEEIQKTFESAFIQLLYTKENKKPIVPIILAGDDICFWSQGKESVGLSVKYIKYVSNYKDSNSVKSRLIKRIKKIGNIHKDMYLDIEDFFNDFSNLSVSGGVAITNVSYPVARAAGIASGLETKAKEAMRDENSNSEMLKPAILDWEIIRGDNKKTSRSSILTSKPYQVIESKAFDMMIKKKDELIKSFKNQDDKDIRTKYIKLYRKSVKDHNEAKLFAKRVNIEIGGEDVKFAANMIFDAIELANFEFDNKEV